MRLPRRILLIGLVVMTVCFVSRTTPAQGPTSETASSVVERLLSAYGRQWTTGEIKDSIAEGTLTFLGLDGPRITFDVTLLRKGNTQLQRIVKEPPGDLKQGTDGASSWESIAGFYTPFAQGRALQMIESQTSRSVQRLLNYQKENLILRDLGLRGGEHIIEAEDRQGRKTSYFIDPDKNLITKLEFATGQVKDPFGGSLVPDMDTYVFSNNQLIQGVLTSLKIERYSGRNKIEEMQIKTVRYNAGVKDTDFQR